MISIRRMLRAFGFSFYATLPGLLKSLSHPPFSRLLHAWLIFSLCILTFREAVFCAAKDVTILQSNQQSCVLEFKPVFGKAQSVPNEEPLVLHDFEGSMSDYGPADAGRPDIRFRAIPLGFPSIDGNSVQVLAADYEEIQNVHLAAVPEYKIQDGQVVVSTYQKNYDGRFPNAFIPEGISSLESVRQMRSMFVGSVRVAPLQYNPVTKVLRKYSRIVVEVVFGQPTGTRVTNSDHLLLKGSVLNYETSRVWAFRDQTISTQVPVPSVLSTGEWFRLGVTEEGMYRLDASYLSSIGINLTSVDPRTIKIYGNGGAVLPENPTAARPVGLVENAILVQGGGDGQFNSGDAVIFYGRGTRGWTYDPILRVYRHNVHYYSDINYYWLTFGGAMGRRMQDQPSISDSPVSIPDKFTDLVYVDEEKINFLSSGKAWYGQSVNVGSSFTHVFQLPGVIPGDTIRYRGSAAARSSSFSSCAVRENGGTIATVSIGPVDPSGYLYARESAFDVRTVPVLSGSQSLLSFAFSSSSGSAVGWIDWAEVQYPRRLEAVGNYLRFRSQEINGVVEYRLAQFTASPLIFNITIPESVAVISGATGAFVFRANETGSRSEYCATAAFRLPISAHRIPNQNLRGLAGGPEFIIVTSREFRGAANRLAAHREQPAYGNLRTLVAEVDSIYNEFSGGIPDASAIRDFLKYAYDNWTPRPLFVLFLGGCSFDYKNILGSRSSYVPVWQSIQSLDDIGSYSSDDFFTRFIFGSSTPFMVSGRISSRTVAEANTVVDKLIRYDAGSARDEWKTRILFIGDDSWTPEREDGTIHSQQAEVLATIYTPGEFEKRKIYIAEYPTVNTAQGRRKPGAYQAILDEINRGVSITNFTGHGNPTVWTHESIFNNQSSIPQLVNADKLTVVLAATCNFSQMDDARRYTGGELLMNKPDGGAIGVVSATRKVFSGANAALNQRVFASMFSRDGNGRLLVDRPATALYEAKVIINTSNDEKFFYMGDPTMQLQFPRGYASIDSINNEPVLGSPPIQLRALGKVTLSGTVRDSSSQHDPSFNGQSALTLTDASRVITIPNFYHNVSWSYLATGSRIYSGQASILNGKFSATFIVPKDISFADSTGRVVAYLSSNSGTDGVGYTSNVRIGGTDTTAAPDVTGPVLSLYLDSRAFRSGDPVSPEPVLFVDMTDSSGINTSIAGIGHRIEAWVNDAAESRDLTDFYTSELDNYQAGTAEFPLRGLPQGRNHVRVRAWDTYNNASTAETFFEVTTTDELRLSDVMNYPNPFADGTSFTFRQNLLTPLNVTVKIYTLAGRVVQTIEGYSTGEPFIRLPWDGRDVEGDVLANGVYLYKVVARTTDGRFTSEALGKLAVLK